jgi:hypothetical protein
MNRRNPGNVTPNAQERTRTSTGYYPHQALNLARVGWVCVHEFPEFGNLMIRSDRGIVVSGMDTTTNVTLTDILAVYDRAPQLNFGEIDQLVARLAAMPAADVKRLAREWGFRQYLPTRKAAVQEIKGRLLSRADSAARTRF